MGMGGTVGRFVGLGRFAVGETTVGITVGGQVGFRDIRGLRRQRLLVDLEFLVGCIGFDAVVAGVGSL